METSKTESQAPVSQLESQASEAQAVERHLVPGLPQEYQITLQVTPDLMDKIARLKVLGDRRSAASLGLFVVLFFGVMLTLLAMGEIFRLILPGASALLDLAMGVTLILIFLSPVVLAAMLGISLGQAIRQPRRRINPDSERVWLLQRGNQTVGKLRLLPEATRLQLLWVRLQPNHRGQGIGAAFVQAVLQAEGLPCRVKLTGEQAVSHRDFFQNCDFQFSDSSQALKELNQPHAWRKSKKMWMTYEPGLRSETT